MTPIERHDAIDVKREDLYDPGFANGKLRGVLPWLSTVAKEYDTIVNAGATHSNSHALAAYCGQRLGLRVVCVTNTRPDCIDRHPQLLAAQSLGATVVASGTGHLGPLRARAQRLADAEDAYLVPWGFSTPAVSAGYAAAVAEVPQGAYDVHVVPMGAGGWAAGVLLGVLRDARPESVCAVAVMPTPNDWNRLVAMLPPWTDTTRLALVNGGKVQPLPWPADPRYEGAAWYAAQRLTAQGQRVLFWSIGQAVG